MASPRDGVCRRHDAFTIEMMCFEHLRGLFLSAALCFHSRRSLGLDILASPGGFWNVAFVYLRFTHCFELVECFSPRSAVIFLTKALLLATWWVVGISHDHRQIPTGVAFETDLALLLLFDVLIAYAMDFPFALGVFIVVAFTCNAIGGY